MQKPLTFLIALVLTTLPLGAAADPVQPDLDEQVHCSVIFALIAREQDAGKSAVTHYPAMDEPGRAFFVETGLRLINERKMPVEDMRPYFMARVNEVQEQIAASPDPTKALDDQFNRCLPLFAAVAPEAAPKAQ